MRYNPAMMEFSLYRTLPDHLEGEWNALLPECVTHVPFMRYEYIHTWWQTRGGGEWPKAELVFIAAHRNGKLIGGAPLFINENQNGQPALFLIGSIEISDYLDLVVRPHDQNEFCLSLLKYLDGPEVPPWKSLDFYNILESSPTLQSLEAAAKALGWSYEHERLQHCPSIQLPGDWQVYLAGIDKKQRHEIRRKMRRLEESGLDNRWYFVEDEAALDSEIESFLGLMEQVQEKANFLTPAMREHMRLTIRCAYKAGCLKLAFLEINGDKAATKLCFDYLYRLWGYNSGFSKRYLDLSPGWVLTAYLIQWANEQKRTEFDFMRGDEEYKYRFGGVDRFIVRAVIHR